MSNITAKNHMSDWFSAWSSLHSSYFCIDFHNPHWEGASPPPYGCCFVLNASLGCRRLFRVALAATPQPRQDGGCLWRRRPKCNMASGTELLDTKQSETCRSPTLVAKQRKRKRFQSTRPPLQNPSVLPIIVTGSHARLCFCSDILPAPCGVCARVRMPVCARPHRMHVTMFEGALGCTRVAAVCMHCATCWWRWRRRRRTD